MYTNISTKNIAVFGLGVSGMAALRFCQCIGANTVVIGNNPNIDWDGLKAVTFYHQDDAQTSNILSSLDIIILSPGIPREHPVLKKAIEKEVPIVNEVEIAASYFPGKIIAVTGTNGKTTTVSLLAQSLKQLGKSVFLGGNYGTPFLSWVCDFLEKKTVPTEYAVIELSSFQLESLDSFSADLGMILNITPSHMERYNHFDDYKKAKLNLKNHCHSFLTPKRDSKSGEDSIKNRDQYLNQYFDLKEFKLVGDYNVDNLWFVIKSLDFFELPVKEIQLSKLKGEPFRLEKIAKNIFNDGKSTNWRATVSAVLALQMNGDITLILGGKSRDEHDLPSDEIVSLLKSKVNQFYFFGESGKKLRQLFEDEYFETLDDVVKHLDLNKTILFSPAYPSFDQFKNYVERGKYFTYLVEQRLNEL
jgi:UDP-N-acetylmuramoylalanine--D-glutamate ligase